MPSCHLAFKHLRAVSMKRPAGQQKFRASPAHGHKCQVCGANGHDLRTCKFPGAALVKNFCKSKVEKVDRLEDVQFDLVRELKKHRKKAEQKNTLESQASRNACEKEKRGLRMWRKQRKIWKCKCKRPLLLRRKFGNETCPADCFVCPKRARNVSTEDTAKS